MADNKTKEYGADLPALTYSATGFVNNDSSGLLTGILATPATAESDAGTYPITQGSLDAGSNYSIVFTDGALTVTGIDLPPVITSPETLNTNVDEPITFSASVDDPDAGANPIELSWSVTNGTLTLGSTAGLTFSSGDGTSDSEGTVTGTLAALNDAFAGATFTPSVGFVGAAYVSLYANDLGNTGTGGPLDDFQYTLIVVGPDLQATNDTATTSEGKAIDVDVLENDLWVTANTPTVTLLTNPIHGTAVSAEGTIRYTPSANYHGTDSFTYRITDTHGHHADATAYLKGMGPGGSF